MTKHYILKRINQGFRGWQILDILLYNLQNFNSDQKPLYLILQVNKNCGKRPQFVKPKGQTGTFVINHYAGPVSY